MDKKFLKKHIIILHYVTSMLYWFHQRKSMLKQLLVFLISLSFLFAATVPVSAEDNNAGGRYLEFGEWCAFGDEPLKAISIGPDGTIYVVLPQQCKGTDPWLLFLYAVDPQNLAFNKTFIGQSGYSEYPWIYGETSAITSDGTIYVVGLGSKDRMYPVQQDGTFLKYPGDDQKESYFMTSCALDDNDACYITSMHTDLSANKSMDGIKALKKDPNNPGEVMYKWNELNFDNCNVDEDNNCVYRLGSSPVIDRLNQIVAIDSHSKIHLFDRDSGAENQVSDDDEAAPLGATHVAIGAGSTIYLSSTSSYPCVPSDRCSTALSAFDASNPSSAESNLPKIWSQKIDSDHISPPVVGDDAVYVGSASGKLYAFNFMGEKMWEFQPVDANGTPRTGRIFYSPAIGEDKDGKSYIYFGSDDGYFYEVRDDGTSGEKVREWNLGGDRGGRVLSAPAITPNGLIYVLSNQFTNLLLWELDIKPRKLGNAPWPMFQHDLRRTGAALAPVASVSPLSYDFGEVEKDQSSPDVSFTVKNEGDAELKISSVELIGPNKNFSIKDDPCSGQNLPPDGTCTVEVIFQPASRGIKNAQLEIKTNDPNRGIIRVTLQGKGILPSGLSVAPSMYDFGNILIGEHPSKTFTIKNYGTKKVTLIDVAIDGSKDFDLTKPAMGILGSNNSQTFEVAFKPSSAEEKKASITVQWTESDSSIIHKITVDVQGRRGVEGAASLRGRVYDLYTSEPIPDARVTMLKNW
ncbi:choice-of-anchor D domain-containing protein [candidate division WS5 bacterium]|uniref:Choice-of-anchor D domain-containing protein n=1 Tax=candidate division WS5 bacterium TaxID=2093353 RepID=A0A419DDE0_9BACT|nr:MAG: choice-of-anchor D domain-containing protein [candidate division WS5 bacterium]